MYYFIINPASRSGKGARLWQKIRDRMDREQFVYQVFFTTTKGEATRFAGEISSYITSEDILCVLGGDGTLNEVLNGLVLTDALTFAYLPTGSGNDFARGLHLLSDDASAIEALLHPRTYRTIDIGTCKRSSDAKEMRAFGISSGIGFDASVCHEALSSKLKHFFNRLGLGKLSYGVIALKQLFFFHPFKLTVLMDRNRRITFSDTYFAAAMNTRYEGGGFPFCPKAEPDDGFLDLIIVQGIPKLMVFFFLPFAYFGRHTHIRGIHIYRCRQAAFITDTLQPLHFDGESGGYTDITYMGIRQEKLRIITG